MEYKREELSNIIREWCQAHDTNFQINSVKSGDEGFVETGSYFCWLIKQTDSNINMLELLNRLDAFIAKKLNKSAGLFCKKCSNFYEYAEANQFDGSLICYGCRND